MEESLHTISVAELKALTEDLFPYAGHPWLEKFADVVNDRATGKFYHAMADERVHVIYCHDKNIGLWFILGSGRGPLQADQLRMMKEIVDGKP